MTDRACKILAAIATPFIVVLVLGFLGILGAGLIWLMELPKIGPVFMVLFFIPFVCFLLYGFWLTLQESCIKYQRDRKTK